MVHPLLQGVMSNSHHIDVESNHTLVYIYSITSPILVISSSGKTPLNYRREAFCDSLTNRQHQPQVPDAIAAKAFNEHMWQYVEWNMQIERQFFALVFLNYIELHSIVPFVECIIARKMGLLRMSARALLLSEREKIGSDIEPFSSLSSTNISCSEP